MKLQLISLCMASLMAASLPVQAAEEDEGIFSRSWRGFKSVIGVGDETTSQDSGKRADRDYDDDDDEDKYKGEKAGKPKHKSGQADLDELRREGRFSSEQARLIRERLGMSEQQSSGEGKGKKPKKLPPGLKKKLERGGELPPGWKMKFERGEVVSDEVWAQAHRVPDDLASQIGTVAGTELIQVNDRVARVLTSTREILDIVDLVTGP